MVPESINCYYITLLSRTCAIIQSVIRDTFNDCTVLTFAHRLNTVTNSDRVMVIDDGSLKVIYIERCSYLMIASQRSFLSEAKKTKRRRS